MKVKLLTSLGKPDCRACNLDPDEAKEGEVVDVTKDVADQLLKLGKATEDLKGDGPSPKLVADPQITLASATNPATNPTQPDPSPATEGGAKGKDKK